MHVAKLMSIVGQLLVFILLDSVLDLSGVGEEGVNPLPPLVPLKLQSLH